jgi:phage terminase large subunit
MIPEWFDWKNPDYARVLSERMLRLERIRNEAKKDPTVWVALKAHYKDNPVDFIADWAMTFDPRNIERDLPTDIPMVPFPKQVEAIEWLRARWKARENGLIDKSRDMGASWIAVWYSIWMWLFFPGSIIGFGSRKEEYVDAAGDMKAIFPKIRFGIARLPKELRPAGYSMRTHAPFMKIFNPETGGAIVGEAGDSIGRGARTSVYFVDESAFLERPLLADAALSQTTNCRIDVSTPNGEGNPFEQKRFGGHVAVLTLHWKDHPAKDDEWYRRTKAKLNNSVIVAQELDIDYKASSSDQYVAGTICEDAMQFDRTILTPEGPTILGVDVARFGNNKTAFALRRGRVVFWVKLFSNRDTTEIAGMIKDTVESSPTPIDQVAIDVIGLGAGVYDQAKRLLPKIDVVPVNSAEKSPEDQRDFNMRAYMWRQYKEWLEDKPVSLPNDRQLKIESTSPRYTYRGGRLLIESKEDMVDRGVQSPDAADAVCLTFAKPAVVRNERERRKRDWKTS